MDNATKEKWRIRRWKGWSTGLSPRGPFFQFSQQFLPFLVFITLLQQPGVFSLDITWVPNLDWGAKSNWENGFLPENGAHVVLPLEMRLSVGLPVRSNDLEISGLELPRDGALALPETGKITISESTSSSKIARWIREGPLLWADPKNWLSERSSEAVPHLERIPCQGDTVVLPGVARTFSMQLPGATGIKIRAIKIANDTGPLPPWEWKYTRERMEFARGPMTVEYSGFQSCDSCPCQQETNGREILKEVCDTPGAKCQDLACEYPVNVEGHCCYYCGGRLLLTTNPSLSFIKRMSDQALAGFGNSLAWYSRRTWDSKTEVLIAGKNGGYSVEEIATAVATLANALKEQGIEVTASESSGAELHGSKSIRVLGPFFGSLLIILLVLLAVFPYHGYPLRRVLGDGWNGLRNLVQSASGNGVIAGVAPTLPKRPFGFARFENAADSDVELAPSPKIGGIRRRASSIEEDVDEDENEEGAGRFANPLYRSGRRGPEVPSFAALKNTNRDDVDVADEDVDLTID